MFKQLYKVRLLSGGSAVKNLPGPGRPPGVGTGNPLQYSCLKSPIARAAWRAIVHGAAEESDTTERLNNNHQVCCPHLHPAVASWFMKQRPQFLAFQATPCGLPAAHGLNRAPHLHRTQVTHLQATAESYSCQKGSQTKRIIITECWGF